MQKTFNFFYAFLLAVLGFGATLMAEDITLTTYYPAPYGAYNELTTTGNTFLSTATGSVGIGVSDPKSKLDVEGGVAIGADYSGTSAAPANGLIVQGKVGIGTNTIGPSDTLTVTGTINATGYSVGNPATAGATNTIQYLKPDFISIGTITVTNGIVTEIN